MAIVKVENKTYEVDRLYQWDLNQVLEIRGLSMAQAPEVHFTTNTMVRAVRVFADMDATGVITAAIPNALLQKADSIRAIICLREGEAFKSCYEILIPVKARPQPADYTLTTDADTYSFIELENLVYDSVAEMTAKYTQVAAIVADAVKEANTAATNANAASAAASAAVEGKVSVAGGTMTGDLNMGARNIKNLAAPVDDADAVPKSYATNADNLVSGIANVVVGGTGRNHVTAGSFLVGNGNSAMEEKTAEEVRELIGAFPAVLIEGVHYGDELPDPGSPGRLYFKKVAE